MCHELRFNIGSMVSLREESLNPKREPMVGWNIHLLYLFGGFCLEDKCSLWM